ncbi:MAG: GNAT family N-acetyltransferase [Rickettsiales bacterium]|nr:GNAT family N-acetyltransferase [Rickettsiales bacterium]
MNFDKLIFRKAEEKDLLQIVTLLADDILGKNRENLENIGSYKKAFDEISSDKNNFLAVVEFENKIIGTCHLTLMTSLTMKGSKRMNIEAVRVSNEFSNQGIGSWMMKKAIEFAKNNNVKIVQLTSNKERHDAHRFYERLGFIASHKGMKLVL